MSAPRKPRNAPRRMLWRDEMRCAIRANTPWPGSRFAETDVAWGARSSDPKMGGTLSGSKHARRGNGGGVLPHSVCESTRTPFQPAQHGPLYRPAGSVRSSTARHSRSAQRRVAPHDRYGSSHYSGRWSWPHRACRSGHRAVCQSADSGQFFAGSAPVLAGGQRNSAAADTLLRHTDSHAQWSLSSACAWRTPFSKGDYSIFAGFWYGSRGAFIL